ncbi:MAG TPA: hypothetical protein PKE27_13570 [Povalibacter sp.]|uniref:hypothetical protein n=1 Tax=Povalibacter sp. TaxID=1962978 RepID=UPI002B960919|nr:hypothetical protein [Povalibacter sp.]HMN45608.1 hypothetical protein [Povalibacter sp.]
MERHTRVEAAIYWSAVSLIVCEGLPIDKAAEQLGVAGSDLREILHRRQTLRLVDDAADAPSSRSATVVPFARH